MKKRIFDGIIVLFAAILLMGVLHFDLADTFVKFGIIPLLIFYYLGSYSQKKYSA